MDADHELAEIYTLQAMRAGRAAVVVAAGGVVGSLFIAVVVADEVGGRAVTGTFAFLGALGAGLALTAAVYTLVSAWQTQAQAAAVRHRDAALGGTAGRATSTQP